MPPGDYSDTQRKKPVGEEQNIWGQMLDYFLESFKCNCFKYI